MGVIRSIVGILRFLFWNGGKGKKSLQKRDKAGAGSVDSLPVKESALGFHKTASEGVGVELADNCDDLSSMPPASLADEAASLGGCAEVGLTASELVDESAKPFKTADDLVASKGELAPAFLSDDTGGGVFDGLSDSKERQKSLSEKTPFSSETVSDVSGEQSSFGETERDPVVDELTFDSLGKTVGVALPTDGIGLTELLDARSATMLISDCGLTVRKLSRWLGVDCRSLESALDQGLGDAEWRHTVMSESDEALIGSLIRDGLFSWETEEGTACLLNNGKGEAYAIIVDGDGVRLFELSDMPAKTRQCLVAKGMDRLTYREMAEAPSLGEFVEILGVKHFKPTSVGEFRNLASRRGMSCKEYAEFLFGVPYCSHQTAITDNVVVEFLTRCTFQDGTTVIPAGYEGQWLRAFAKSHGMTDKQLLGFYGFKLASDSSGGGFICPTKSKIWRKHPGWSMSQKRLTKRFLGHSKRTRSLETLTFPKFFARS